MKKLIYTLTALLAFGLGSCSSTPEDAAFSEDEKSVQDSIDNSAMDFEALEAMDDSSDSEGSAPTEEHREPMTPAEPGSALPSHD
ncbi:MAG: hypothetical protein RL577_1325 [Bacteroidota bacterium]|jgi:hypothetical protein